MEEARQILNIDSSSSSSDQNGDEKSLRRSPEEEEEEEEKHYGSTQDRIHSMSFDDLRSLLVHNTTTTTNPVDSVNITRSRENASTDVDLARRMCDNKRDSSDQRPPRGRPPGTSIPRQQLPMGEIVEVEGGHIVRSTGRKDRHSKVYTAKGPRDRRVRLSALTAIQFYDVQDRLGFDRPSKAVDWLIKKAKTSIDELTQLPPLSALNIPNQEPKAEDEGIKEQAEQEIALENEAAAKPGARATDSRAIARERARERAKERTQERSDVVAKAQTYLRPRSHLFSLNPASTSPTVPTFQLKNAADSENLATGSNAANQQMGMRSINNISSTPSDSISRTLNLEALQRQSFYQYLFSHTNNQALQNFSTVSQFDGAAAAAALYAAAPANSDAAQNSNQQTNQSLFSSSTASAFQIPSGFSREIVMQEQLHHEFLSSQPQPHRISSAPPVWNCNSIYTDFGNNNTNNIAVSAPNMMRGGGGHYNSLTLRGTLQSSSSPVRVRSNPPLLHDNAAAGQCPQTGNGFSGFRIPARIQGIDENADVKPSPASSNSRF